MARSGKPRLWSKVVRVSYHIHAAVVRSYIRFLSEAFTFFEPIGLSHIYLINECARGRPPSHPFPKHPTSFAQWRGVYTGFIQLYTWFPCDKGSSMTTISNPGFVNSEYLLPLFPSPIDMLWSPGKTTLLILSLKRWFFSIIFSVTAWSRWLVITWDVVVCFVALSINMALPPFFLPHVNYSRR